MGLFDYLKRKRETPPPVDDRPSPHYALAHYALRFVALSDPLRFLEVCGSPEAGERLQTILEDVEKKAGRKAKFSASDIYFYPDRLGNHPCVLVEMPEPDELGEAHLVALVVPTDVSLGVPTPEKQAVGRYFTLEKSQQPDGTPCTILGEWDEETHFNHGEGPAPTIEAFYAALEQRRDLFESKKDSAASL